ncbi:MAG: sigma factor-like helix-turn-helix DNA-binding protein [Polyangiaceae bacterium]
MALDALPTYHRAVIVMREIEGLSYEEMAQVTGVSKGTTA